MRCPCQSREDNAKARCSKFAEQARFRCVILSAHSFQRKSGNRTMDIGGIILGALAAAALLFLLIGLGLGMIRPPPLYGPPEKNGSTKVEPPKDDKPSR
jgi:hypothetical protein